MKRTTVLLPDEIVALLEAERRRRDVSAAEVVREALAQYFGEGQPRRALPFIGIGHSGQSGQRPGTAERAEEILAREWTRDALAGNRDR